MAKWATPSVKPILHINRIYPSATYLSIDLSLSTYPSILVFAMTEKSSGRRGSFSHSGVEVMVSRLPLGTGAYRTLGCHVGGSGSPEDSGQNHR